jgi:hypothetical protein
MRLLVENLSKEYRGNVRALSEVHLALGPGLLVLWEVWDASGSPRVNPHERGSV